MFTKILNNIKSEATKQRIIERCGEFITADGLECPHCNCKETYKDMMNTDNVDKWFFMIRAFRVDMKSECTNCGRWFELSDLIGD